MFIVEVIFRQSLEFDWLCQLNFFLCFFYSSFTSMDSHASPNGMIKFIYFLWIYQGKHLFILGQLSEMVLRYQLSIPSEHLFTIYTKLKERPWSRVQTMEQPQMQLFDIIYTRKICITSYLLCKVCMHYTLEYQKNLTVNKT